MPDDDFWEDYKNRKSEQKEIATANAVFTRTSPYEFKYSNNYTITPEQLIECIEDTDPRVKPNYVIIDLRTEKHIEEFKLPSRAKVFSQII
jgi:hypothetical protein